MLIKYIVLILVYIVLSIPARCQIYDFFNRPPTIDEIDEPVVALENSGNHSIILTGISYGGDRNFQQVTITAKSSKPDLIPHPSIYYDQGSIANLNFIPSKDQNGSTKITITLDDGQRYNNITEMSFKIDVTPVNGRPSFQLLSGPPAIEEGTGAIKIKKFAFNMDDGDPDEDQKLYFITDIKETTNNLTFKEAPSIDKKKGDLTYEVNSNSYGEATISVFLKDNGGTENGGNDTSLESTFVIIVTGINDTPTLDPISNPGPIAEDAAVQQIALTGISAGDSENQPLGATATSSNLELISEITVNYASPSTTGSLSYQANANKFGTSIITLTIDDGQRENNTVSQSFTVEVDPVADTPSITNAVVKGSGQTTSGLVISRNPVDGEEVTHFKITNILNGTLYLNNGVTQLSNGSFINYNQGNSGLKFLHSYGNMDPGSFNLQAATGKGDQFLGGAKILAEITIENDPPEIKSVPGTIVDISTYYSYEIVASDPDPKDQLTYTFTIPEKIRPWLKWRENDDNSALLFGTPPSGSQGIYDIYVKVEDLFGQYDEQRFKLEVKKLNNKPVLTAIVRNIDEDETLYFSLSLFKGHYNDLDGDELKEIKIVNTPQQGRLYLTGTALAVNDVIPSKELAKLKYVPNNDYYGEDKFGWNGSDGKEYAQYPQQVSILIAPVNDAPTLNAITNPGPVREDAPAQQIALTGISAGVSEKQPLKVSAISSNLELISEITINFASPSANGSVSYQANENKFGTSTITITVDDGEQKNNTAVQSFTVEVNPVADTPSITNALIKGSGQTTSGLVISRNPADGEEVSHIKITNILNGALYLNDGVTPLSNGSFISYMQGNSGLKFTPSYGHKDPGSFKVQAATEKGDQFLGGAKVLAEITIENDPPEITSLPATVVEISKYYSYKILASDPDPNDQLTFTFIIPERIQSWLRSADNNDNSALLFGTPPSGSEGLYDININVEDPFGQKYEQSFMLEVKKLNNKPELRPITRNIDEDDTLNFNLSLFQDHFFDLDGDDLQKIEIVNSPQKGRLLLDGIELSTNDIIDSKELTKFKYIPDQDYYGLDIFDWTATDGKDYSLIPQRVSVFIASVNDAPEIINLENAPITFEYGDDGKNLSDSLLVVDADGDKMEKAIIRIAENYVRGEDSIYYEQVDGITYHWQDTLGELTIRGIEKPIVYEKVIRSLMYINLNRLSPTNSYRLFEFVLFDADTFSLPVTRLINFENTFVELEIPTGFTPNDDGVNDTWGIANLGRYEEIQVSVFSRSGKIMYNSEDHHEWDGTYNRNLVPSGPYYYLINIEKFKKVYRGTVNVLR